MCLMVERYCTTSCSLIVGSNPSYRILEGSQSCESLLMKTQVNLYSLESCGRVFKASFWHTFHFDIEMRLYLISISKWKEISFRYRNEMCVASLWNFLSFRYRNEILFHFDIEMGLYLISISKGKEILQAFDTHFISISKWDTTSFRYRNEMCVASLIWTRDYSFPS